MELKILALEIVPRLPQEQANTISKRKQKEIGVLGFWFKNSSTRRKNNNKLIQN